MAPVIAEFNARPTRSLVGSQRWFDELYVWTEGGTASTTQRARFQIEAMRDAFQWLEYDMVERIEAKLGHPERCPHGWPIDPAFEQGEELRLAVGENLVGEAREVARAWRCRIPDGTEVGDPA